MRPEVAAGVNNPRTVDAYEATLNDARKDIKQRAKQQQRHGLVTLGNSPMERRRARAAQLLGDQWRPARDEDQPPVLGRTERLVEREIERLRHEYRLEGAAVRADIPADEEAQRQHEHFLAQQEEEEREERRKAIARANRSKFGRDEHKRRYGQDVKYRSGGGPRGMSDLTKEEDKRAYLKSMHDDFTARGGIVGAGKRTGHAAGEISMHKFAIGYNVSPESVRQSLLTWEALVDIYDRTGKWPQVRRARFAVMQGWRAGDPFPLPHKVKKEKLPKDLVDEPARSPETPIDYGKAGWGREKDKGGEEDSETGNSPLIYSEGLKRRHPNQ